MVASRLTSSEINSLVRPDRVHQRVYTDPAVFDLEMERIYERNWVFVGHDSRIPKPGDFFKARVGRKEIVVVRTDDGSIVGLLNRCPHRGGMVVGPQQGHTRTFECLYHGWSFKRDGKLLGVPMPQGYDFDLESPKWSMSQVSRLESYRGFLFANLGEGGPDLASYLEPVRDSFDNLLDRAPDGTLVQAGGRFQQVYYGNWKVHVENVCDFIHAGFLHRSSFLTVKDWEKEHGGPREDSDQMVQMIKANGLPLSDWDKSDVRALSYGHATLGGFYRDPKIAPQRSDPDFLAYKNALIDTKGEQRTEEILSLDRFSTLIYPNMVLNIRFQQIRVFHPIAPDRTVVESFCFKMGGAPDPMFHTAIRFLTSLNSPSSMISQDDHEMFGRMQKVMTSGGLETADAEWIDFSRQFGREKVVGNEAQAPGSSELACRNQWSAWLSHMAV